MKRIINNDVYITNSTRINYMSLVRQMGTFPLIPSYIFDIIANDDELGILIISNFDEQEMEFKKVENEEIKDFIRKADFILDYDEYNSLSLYKVEKIHDEIVNEYNSNLNVYYNKLAKLTTTEEKDKLLAEYRPILDPLQFEILELLSLRKQKIRSGEIREIPEIKNQVEHNEVESNVEEKQESKIKSVLRRILKPNNKRQ